jgi:hypothetical protein
LKSGFVPLKLPVKVTCVPAGCGEAGAAEMLADPQ